MQTNIMHVSYRYSLHSFVLEIVLDIIENMCHVWEMYKLTTLLA